MFGCLPVVHLLLLAVPGVHYLRFPQGLCPLLVLELPGGGVRLVLLVAELLLPLALLHDPAVDGHHLPQILLPSAQFLPLHLLPLHLLPLHLLPLHLLPLHLLLLHH